MTTENAVDLVRFMVADKMPGKELSVEDLNSLLEVATYSLYEELYGLPGSPKGYETDEQNMDIMRRFKTQSNLTITTGISNLPVDFMHWSSCNVASSVIPVELVTDMEYESRTANSITMPTTQFPIARLFSSTLKISPTTIPSISLTYLRKPVPAYYGSKIENGITVFDSAISEDIDFPESKHIDFVRHILKLLGISMNDQAIIQYSEQKQSQVT